MAEPILFDLDGTLLDSIRLILSGFRFSCEQNGLEPLAEERWLRGIGLPLKEQFREISQDPGEIDRLLESYREFNVRFHDELARPYPGVVEVIAALSKAGRPLAIVSSKSRAGIARGLRLLGLQSAFGVIVAGDEVQRGKPHPEPVERALRALGAGPEGAVFVGDSPHDMACGRAAGVRTGAALWGPFGRAELAPHAPDYWLSRPEDILTRFP